MRPSLRTLQRKPRTTLVVLFSLFFSLNIFAQPSNDNCSGATTLTSNTSCNNNQYRLKNATASSGIPVGCAAGGTHYDVWFKFTAQGTSQTVTISSLQSSFTNPEIQLFSGSCGSLTSVACGTLTLTQTGLTIGNTYYVRVSNIGSQITSNSDRFDICVTHPVPPPSNDDCSSATTITSGNSCTTTIGTLLRATSGGPAGACAGSTITNTYDVWYRFQAVNDSQTVTIGNLGSRLTATTTYMEVFSGTCGSLTSIAGCLDVSGANARRTLPGLTVGSFYYVRLYVQSNPTVGTTTESGFSICVQNPPSNDECAGAILLTTPSGICNGTSGSLTLATASSNSWGACGAGPYYDLWFSFVAGPAVTHIINIGSLGASLNAANLRIQLFSGTCAGLISLNCVSGSTTLSQAGLINGATYYVRVGYTAYQLASGSGSNFTICVTTGAAPPPNDDCSGAIVLTSSSTCTNIAGTIHYATASTPAVPGSCGTGQDVWYSFVAQTAYPQIQLSGILSNLTSSNGRIQLLKGSCGSFTPVGTCVTITAATATINTATNPGGAGLTVGATYYIRIAHNTSTTITNNGNFNICVTDPPATGSAILDYSKSYVNLSDTATGGTIDPGDILEIRATLVIRPNGGVRAIDSVAFYDTLKAGGGLHYYDSIATRTNEGKLYKYFTTSNADADAGWYTTAGAGTDTTIQINMGTGATRSARGKLNSISVPRFNTGGTTANCIILATYRVQVNASYGQTVNFGGGSFSYRDSATGIFSTIQFPPDSIMIFQSPGSCPNSVSQTNILGDESNGTFGSGNTQNRGTSPNTNYLYATFAASAPQDYYYGIANNTSANGSTNQLWVKSGSVAARVHNVWDITGDHTGATNTAKGNLPAAVGSSGGYMLAINASYKTDVAFDFNVSGACPSTYYEISFWLKNICYRCGCDSTGRFSGSVGYQPTGPGDSTGVKPNIAIQINGKDYYTTGNIRYMGLGGTQTGSDTLNQWVQRSFVYQTGANETSFTMTLRNNAPGGGGNDWAIDDIAFKTCTPELELLPGPNPFTCDSNVVEMSTVVRSYYNNYNYYMWEKSIDGGVTWTSTGVSGAATPTWNGSEYEYTVDYPPFIAYYSDSGSMYRVAVATSAANLAGSCRFNESAEITLSVDPCGDLLKNDILSFRGKNESNHAVLYWNTSKETTPVIYEIQKSKDGSHFEKIGELEGFKDPAAENNSYRFVDPESLDNTISYYRIRAVKTQENKLKYSKVIQLIGDKAGLRIESLINPFNTQVKFDLISGDEGAVQVQILDQYQHILKAINHTLVKGKNNITVTNTDNLPAGFYILRVVSGSNVINKKIIRKG